MSNKGLLIVIVKYGKKKEHFRWKQLTPIRERVLSSLKYWQTKKNLTAQHARSSGGYSAGKYFHKCFKCYILGLLGDRTYVFSFFTIKRRSSGLHLSFRREYMFFDFVIFFHRTHLRLKMMKLLRNEGENKSKVKGNVLLWPRLQLLKIQRNPF